MDDQHNRTGVSSLCAASDLCRDAIRAFKLDARSELRKLMPRENWPALSLVLGTLGNPVSHIEIARMTDFEINYVTKW